MKTLAIILILSSFSISAQNFKKTDHIQPKEDYENILVEKQYSDQHASTYIIWVKENVKAHKHVEHTEQVYVLEGKGIMNVGEQTDTISTGDLVIIPQGAVHSVVVISEEPMKVISIQTPEFLGKDRVFVDSKE